MPTDPAKLGALDTAYARNKDKPGVREAWQGIRNYVAYFGKWPNPAYFGEWEGRPEAMLLLEAAQAELPSAEISIAANVARARGASEESVDDASRAAKNNALRGLPSQAAQAERDDWHDTGDVEKWTTESDD